MSDVLKAEVGDVFFTRSESLLGAAIRWVERGPKEEKSWANHTGLVTKAGALTVAVDMGIPLVNQARVVGPALLLLGTAPHRARGPLRQPGLG